MCTPAHMGMVTRGGDTRLGTHTRLCTAPRACARGQKGCAKLRTLMHALACSCRLLHTCPCQHTHTHSHVFTSAAARSCALAHTHTRLCTHLCACARLCALTLALARLGMLRQAGTCPHMLAHAETRSGTCVHSGAPMPAGSRSFTPAHACTRVHTRPQLFLPRPNPLRRLFPSAPVWGPAAARASGTGHRGPPRHRGGPWEFGALTQHPPRHPH